MFSKIAVAAVCVALSAQCASAQSFGGQRPALWQGFYIGVTAGGVDSEVKFTGTVNPSSSHNGAALGVHLGYNFQFDQIVLGVEGDVVGSTNDAGTVPNLRGRIGWASGPLLVYGTAGAAWTKVDTSFVNLATGATASFENNHTGFIVGGGIEWQAWRKLSLRGEVLYADFDKKSYTLPGGVGVTQQPDSMIYRVGLSYHFN
jgi:outer membrane immunogenic protein